MKDRPEKGIISQTRALYEQLSGEARLRAQRDAADARRKGPLAKALLAACLVAGLIAAATFIYGFIGFPDAPIRETARGYVGKHGEPHTREDYEQYKLWLKLVVASFGLVFLTGFGAVAAERMGSRAPRRE
ncbi:MAG: hypothetical protein ACLGJB_23410 [Blastocatellia bacterium]